MTIIYMLVIINLHGGIIIAPNEYSSLKECMFASKINAYDNGDLFTKDFRLICLPKEKREFTND